MNLKIKKLHPDAIVPSYATSGAACFDLHSLVEDFNPTPTGPTHIFRTGLSFEVPFGWALMIYSRSGDGFVRDTRLANCVGVIDSDYRGEVKVKLTVDDLHGQVTARAGDRVAQAMLVQVPRVEFEIVDELSDTDRGTGGFGSTGS